MPRTMYHPATDMYVQLWMVDDTFQIATIDHPYHGRCDVPFSDLLPI